MANPRQRRKARSSSHKPVSHSLRAKKKLKKNPPIRGPKVLQDAWDKRKTVRQNYALLGLVHTLDPLASGGVEPVEGRTERTPETVEEATRTTITEPGVASSSAIPVGFGRIVRDEAGNVVRVEMAGEGDGVIKDMEELVPELEGSVRRQWVTELGGARGVSQTGQSVVSALEQLGAASASAGPRHASAGELGYLERLVGRHGRDVEGMVRDTRLNWEQRTAGELRRGLRRAGIGKESAVPRMEVR